MRGLATQFQSGNNRVTIGLQNEESRGKWKNSRAPGPCGRLPALVEMAALRLFRRPAKRRAAGSLRVPEAWPRLTWLLRAARWRSLRTATSATPSTGAGLGDFSDCQPQGGCGMLSAWPGAAGGRAANQIFPPRWKSTRAQYEQTPAAKVELMELKINLPKQNAPRRRVPDGMRGNNRNPPWLEKLKSPNKLKANCP